MAGRRGAGPRGPLLNDMVEALIVDALKRGALHSEAAAHAGIAPRTMRRWRALGAEAAERAAEGIELSEVEERMRTFRDRTDRAESTARLRAVDRIRDAFSHEEVCMSPWAVVTVAGEPYHPIMDEVGSTVDGVLIRARCTHKVIPATWQAAAWYLERVDPASWGRVHRPAAQPVEDEETDDGGVIERRVEALLSSLFPERAEWDAETAD